MSAPIRDARARGFTDPPGFDEDAPILSDAFERAAIMIGLMTWNTPDDARLPARRRDRVLRSDGECR